MTIMNWFVLGLSLVVFSDPISTWAAEGGGVPASATLLGVANAGSTLLKVSTPEGNRWMEDEVNGEARLVDPKGRILKLLKSKRDEKTRGVLERHEPANESEVAKSLRGACGVRTYHRLVKESAGGRPLAGGKYLAYIEKTHRFYPIPDPPPNHDPAYIGIESYYNDAGPQSIVTWITLFDSNGKKLWRKKYGNTRGPTEVRTTSGWLFEVYEYLSDDSNMARSIYIDESGRIVRITMAK